MMARSPSRSRAARGPSPSPARASPPSPAQRSPARAREGRFRPGGAVLGRRYAALCPAVRFVRLAAASRRHAARYLAASGCRGGAEARPSGRRPRACPAGREEGTGAQCPAAVRGQGPAGAGDDGSGQDLAGGVRGRRQAGGPRPAVPALPRAGRAYRRRGERGRAMIAVFPKRRGGRSASRHREFRKSRPVRSVCCLL